MSLTLFRHCLTTPFTPSSVVGIEGIELESDKPDEDTEKDDKFARSLCSPILVKHLLSKASNFGNAPSKKRRSSSSCRTKITTRKKKAVGKA